MDGLNGEILYVCYLWIYIATWMVFTFFHIFKNAKDLHLLSNKFDLSKHILLVYLSDETNSSQNGTFSLRLTVLKFSPINAVRNNVEYHS